MLGSVEASHSLISHSVSSQGDRQGFREGQHAALACQSSHLMGRPSGQHTPSAMRWEHQEGDGMGLAVAPGRRVREVLSEEVTFNPGGVGGEGFRVGRRAYTKAHGGGEPETREATGPTCTFLAEENLPPGLDLSHQGYLLKIPEPWSGG